MKREKQHSSSKSWTAKNQEIRGQRARQRQLDYQENKANELKGSEKHVALEMLQRSALVRQRLEQYGEISDQAKILEVGSGAHGLIFGFGKGLTIGVDPLAADYKRLFPVWQGNVQTIAAIGEKLPFADDSFDVVLSDNVIDHAENPIGILEDIVRVLKRSGLLYFTVNVHHPIYSLASAAHGLWNGLGVKYEISPFADHTVHFTESRIKAAMAKLPLKILHESSNVNEKKSALRSAKSFDAETIIKKMFYKNALFQMIAVRR